MKSRKRAQYPRKRASRATPPELAVLSGETPYRDRVKHHVRLTDMMRAAAFAATELAYISNNLEDRVRYCEITACCDEHLRWLCNVSPLGIALRKGEGLVGGPKDPRVLSTSILKSEVDRG